MLRLDDNRAIIQTVDFFAPVVDDPYEYGAIAAANSMSDVFAMGGTVIMGLNIAGFPDDLDRSILSEIFRGGSDKMQEAGGVIAGGHTVTDEEPKYGISVTGTIHPDHIWTKGGAQHGDRLYLTKPLGSGVLTTAAKQDVIERHQLEPAIEVMMQLNLYARDAARALPISAATDVTGFGLLGHAQEMAERSGVQLRIDATSLPRLPMVEELLHNGVMAGGLHRNRDHYTSGNTPMVMVESGCDPALIALGFDPQTSGGLLFSILASDAPHLEAAFSNAGLPIWRIGDVVTGSGVYLGQHITT